MAQLVDQDGSSIMIHANADDYVSQPSGNSGPKIACAVIRPAAELR
jgi:Cu-Zn family superoxide dismutase